MDQNVQLPQPEPESFFKQLKQLFTIYKPIAILGIFMLIIFGGTGSYLLANRGNGKAQDLIFKTSSVSDSESGNTRKTTEPNKISNVNISVKPTLKIAPTIIVAPSSTADWLTYSSKYGYSIKYPKDWTAKSQGQIEPKITDYVVFNPATESANTITISYSTRSYQEAATIGATLSNPIIIASVSGIKKTEQDSNGNVTIHVVFPFRVTNSLIFYAQKAFSDTFDKMLTTLKFTN